MVRLRQTTRIVHMAISTMMSRLKIVSDLSKNLTILYELLALGPGITDGSVSNPDEAHAEQKGMAIEFKSVNFGYRSVPNKILRDLSFKIELGCGKNTTINLTNRLYDCESADIYVDGRPICDYKISTIRVAANTMHQSYNYSRLTVNNGVFLDAIPDSEMTIDQGKSSGGVCELKGL
ncbi:unnamed protein product [Rhizoctonia solani]|uniref:Uncharacterized protein n=1 Tax=Rhizoctonia solani TaxID=456999 RepID=A0A8H3BAN1_9AGAM|nr:unnamed protein product [Rhizoctonia solani]